MPANTGISLYTKKSYIEFEIKGGSTFSSQIKNMMGKKNIPNVNTSAK